MPTSTAIIYSIGYPQQLPDNIFQSLLGRLPASMRQGILRFRRWEDAHAAVLGKLLLMRAWKDMGYAGALSDLQYNAYGRPYTEGGPDFNISHSGRRVVCIISPDGGVGIDIEQIRDMPIGDFRSQFTEREWEDIGQAASPLETFYYYWTAKEAVSKADGRGLNLPMAGLAIGENSLVVIDGRSWLLKHEARFAGYVCHVALEMPVGGNIINEDTPQLKFNELYINDLYVLFEI